MISGHSVPESIGKYQLIGEVGRGGMGVVYKAYDPMIDRFVAIKCLNPNVLQTEYGEETLKRFMQEMKAVGRLNHPNVVSIYDALTYEGLPCFIMEFIEGKELKYRLFQKKDFSIEECINIVTGLLKALSYTHELKVIHRDIKPENIFLTNDGEVKIADFGIAHIENSELTTVGSVLGTPSYMSPEQCLGKGVDARSDLFSVAIVFYEMLTMEKAFKGGASHTIMGNILNTHPEPPSKLNQQVPSHLDKVLKKALMKNPDERFQSAEEFLEALSSYSQSSTTSNILLRPKNLALLLGGVLSLGGLGVGYQWWSQNKSLNSEVRGAAIQSSVSSNNGSSTNSSSTNGTSEEMLLSHDDQQKVNKLLAVARAHKLVQRYVFPPSSNAYQAYQLVLDIDPNNQKAKEGIHDIAYLFLEQTKNLHQQGAASQVDIHTEVAKKLFFFHKPWQDFIQQVALDKKTVGE